MFDADKFFQKVDCPFCGAKVGKPCRTANGRFTEWSHVVRQDKARETLGTDEFNNHPEEQ